MSDGWSVGRKTLLSEINIFKETLENQRYKIGRMETKKFSRAIICNQIDQKLEQKDYKISKRLKL